MNTPVNHAIKNFAHKTSFRLDIPDGGMTRSFQLNVQETQIPGMIAETVKLNLNPMMKSTIAGSGVSFDPLSVRIILDEEMEAYTDIFQWMMSTIDFKNNVCTKPAFMPPFLLLHIIDNSKRKIVCTFKYIEPFPVSMGSADFSYSEDGNMAMQMDVQIAYKYFEIERNGVTISALPNTAAAPKQSARQSLHPSLRG